jgi:putative peptidoglycan lipid II flippase
LHDTRTPLHFAMVRIALSTGLGYLCAIPLPPVLGIDARWGVAGLTFASSLAGWVEFALLRSTLNRRIGRTGLPFAGVAKLWTAAIAGAVAAWLVKLALGPRDPLVVAALVLLPYGLIYIGATYGWRVPEIQVFVERLVRLVRSVVGRTR